MKVYLVGGAVRDSLLGETVVDHDWVVVGATPEIMQAKGFMQVGKDFPVFLHPESKEEYALARLERKTGRGHQQFAFHFAPTVSLEEDLKRRDLTINAIAQDENAQLIDPYGGVKDIEDKVLRHVSEAFLEDPLRVLRLLRFHARFFHYGFRIDPSTFALCQKMVDEGEVFTLSKERIWQEWEKAFASQNPECFTQGLYDLGCLSHWLGDVTEAQFSRMQSALATMVKRSTHPLWRISAWILATPSLLVAFKENLLLSKRYQAWLDWLCAYQADLSAWQSIAAEKRYQILKSSGALKDEAKIQEFMAYVDLEPKWRRCIEEKIQQLQMIKAQNFIAQGLKGEAISQAIMQAQIALLQEP